MPSNPIPILRTVQSLRRLVDLWEEGVIVPRSERDGTTVQDAYTEAKSLLEEIQREAANTPPVSP